MLNVNVLKFYIKKWIDMAPKINICITCVGGRLIYDIIRSIRDADDYQAHIIGVDSNKNAHGRLLCDQFYLVPDAERNQKNG